MQASEQSVEGDEAGSTEGALWGSIRAHHLLADTRSIFFPSAGNRRRIQPWV
jgi:hypothetical protein